jgi:hypothetical protein
MYPETENSTISFDSLPVERLAEAIERIPDFLKQVAEKLDARKEKYRRLALVAHSISTVVERADEL